MKGNRVVDVLLNPSDVPEPEPVRAPTSEAATLLINILEAELKLSSTTSASNAGSSDAEFADSEEGNDEDLGVEGSQG
ncbi:hypothetical protein LIER_41947 [Lithospermum erythrorhizon]|uniref:Uncharacterized protein n=1 Tax=Lithospermum erythrorhizon TaxID=34254 RepID=A0AAV3RGS2_LITER